MDLELTGYLKFVVDCSNIIGEKNEELGALLVKDVLISGVVRQKTEFRAFW